MRLAAYPRWHIIRFVQLQGDKYLRSLISFSLCGISWMESLWPRIICAQWDNHWTYSGLPITIGHFLCDLNLPHMSISIVRMSCSDIDYHIAIKKNCTPSPLTSSETRGKFATILNRSRDVLGRYVSYQEGATHQHYVGLSWIVWYWVWHWNRKRKYLNILVNSTNWIHLDHLRFERTIMRAWILLSYSIVSPSNECLKESTNIITQVS